MNDSTGSPVVFCLILLFLAVSTIGFRYFCYFTGRSLPRRFRSLYESTLFDRIGGILISLFLIGYAVQGVWRNSFWFPGRPHGFYLHGAPVLIMTGAFLCFALAVGLWVFAFYHRRLSERAYWILSRLIAFIGWALFVVALFRQVRVR